MKIQKRFIIHLLLGCGLYIVMLGIALPITLDILLPVLNLSEERYEWIGLPVIVLITIVFILLFGWYVGSPLFLIIKWINQLSTENFTGFQPDNHIYTTKGTLKMRYRLYQEVITQLSDMQSQLIRAKVERTQVEQAKHDWISGISHDLKTPLTYLKGYSSLLLHSSYDWTEEEAQQFIEKIDNKAIHMEELIEDLNLTLRLDDHQSIILDKTKQNLKPVIQQVLADLSNDLDVGHHQFELYSEVEDISLMFDEQLLKRALQNIYINSIVHNGISLHIVTTIKQRSGNIRIHIQDNGKGMSQETLVNIFNRYYRGTTTDQQSEGTGLGMAIVKNLIEAHDGTIDVESTLGKGTTFTIGLPK